MTAKSTSSSHVGDASKQDGDLFPICFALIADWVELFFLSFKLNIDYVNVKERAQSFCRCV